MRSGSPGSTELLDRKPRALSGGQRQRVALARAIVRTPQVFLMDEPLSNLDAKLRVTMRAELKHLSHELRITTVYVTHDQIEAMTLADRVAVMNHGRIRQLGTPEEIYNAPKNLFVAGFIGSPAMNLIEGATENGRFMTEGATIAAVGGGTRDRVVLGVRPEDLTLAAPGEGSFDAAVYASELTGESVLVTVEAGGRRIAAKADRHTRKAIGETVGIRIDPAHAYLFDAASGDRLSP